MDSRKELSLINKHIRQHNREAGETILWFEFVPWANAASAGSIYDDVYDEGKPGDGGRSYAGGLVIPTIYVEEIEDQYTLHDDGRQPTQNILVTVLFADMISAGLSNPWEYETHLNDTFMYDNRWYKVWEYRVRGRLPSEVVIGIKGFEIYVDQEFPYDPGPPNPTNPDLPWPSTFPAVSV